jgi:hypothetical protein
MASGDYSSIIVLPSRGLCYGEGALPDGRLEVEPFSTAEEKLLRSANVPNLVDQLLSGCVRPPGGKWTGSFGIQDLVVPDRVFTLMQLRAISYGRVYHFEYRCDGCGDRVAGEQDLTELAVDWAPDDFSEPWEVYMDMRGVDLGLRMLRGKDEKAIMVWEKQQESRARRNKTPRVGDIGYEYRLARHIVTIDGDEATLDEALRLVKELRGMDLQDLNASLEECPGLDTRVEPICPNCAYPNPQELPMGSEFFRPSRHARASRKSVRGGRRAGADGGDKLRGRDADEGARADVVDTAHPGVGAGGTVEVQSPPQPAPGDAGVGSRQPRVTLDGPTTP